jgi:hypothetical protein
MFIFTSVKYCRPLTVAFPAKCQKRRAASKALARRWGELDVPHCWFPNTVVPPMTRPLLAFRKQRATPWQTLPRKTGRGSTRERESANFIWTGVQKVSVASAFWLRALGRQKVNGTKLDPSDRSSVDFLLRV